jgi:hypothetical protein
MNCAHAANVLGKGLDIFAIGAFLSITFYNLIPEVINNIRNSVLRSFLYISLHLFFTSSLLVCFLSPMLACNLSLSCCQALQYMGLIIINTFTLLNIIYTVSL